MIQSRPRRYDQVFIFRTFIPSFFLTQNKQTNKCFTVGHRTRNSLAQVVDRKIMISNSLLEDR